jgi:hypothetical protein
MLSTAQAPGGGLATARCELQTTCFAKPEFRHVDIDTLVAACRDAICLMPDPYRSIRANRAIERTPQAGKWSACLFVA